MNKLIMAICVLTFCFFSGCGDNDKTQKEFVFDFQDDSEGWLGGFADYQNEQDVEDFYELSFSHDVLPVPLNTNEGALKQSGNNHSDDLFMYVKKRITGLEPNRDYSVHLEIEIATNASSDSFGVGGSPGESVFIKAGASTVEPIKVLDTNDNHFRMNIDKGNQSSDGPNMITIGDFANGTDRNDYVLKSLKTPHSILVRSDSNGGLWVIAGTDSGYESTTTIFYSSIYILLTER